MSTTAIIEGSNRLSQFSLRRHRSIVAAALVFFALLAFVAGITPDGLNYNDISSLATSGAPLALAAIGQTFIILAGGFDLSAGATISLVNVIVATIPQGTAGGQVTAVVAGLAVGAAVGAFNGFFIAYLRLQSIVVTLSTMFLLHGITLLILPDPGGVVAPSLTRLLTGAAIPGVLPSSVVVIAASLGIWAAIRKTRFGVAMYAVGSDREASHAVGIDVKRTQFVAFVLGGLFYGAAGVFIGAQTGSADPLVGDPLLLQSLTAVVLGGTILGGGRGGALGSVLGAYTLMLMINLLLALDVSAYYTTIAEGTVLALAVIGASLGRRSAISQSLRHLTLWLQARAKGVLSTQVATGFLPSERDDQLHGAYTGRSNWLKNNREKLKYVLPVFIAFLLVVVATQSVFSGKNIIFSVRYYDSLLVLCAFLAILALGQGAVILSGGLDLSIPWTIAICGIFAAGLMHGSNEAMIWAVPCALMLGAFIGLLNGIGIAAFGLSPIVVTLASNGILQGIALIYSNGTPEGFASPALRWMMTGQLGGVTPVIWLEVVFVLFGTLLLTRTVFGRWIYALGNSPRVAYLSGVGVSATTIGVYVLSGTCAALVGILIVGFSGQASLGMGDDLLLPSIAVVIVGGTLITGGRGSYIGMLGGVLLLTALQILLSGTTLPHAVRDIIYGAVVLIAVLALRED